MGETLFQIRESLPEKRSILTLKRWKRAVREAIVEEYEGRRVFGITVAQGSEAWTAPDHTPQGVTYRSSWDAEGLKKAGKKARY